MINFIWSDSVVTNQLLPLPSTKNVSNEFPVTEKCPLTGGRASAEGRGRGEVKGLRGDRELWVFSELVRYIRTGSTSWSGRHKNSETHNYCKCTLLTAASVVTVGADVTPWGLCLRSGGAIEHTQLRPWTALLAVPTTGYTHGVWLTFPEHHTSPPGLFTLLQKLDESGWCSCHGFTLQCRWAALPHRCRGGVMWL